MWLALLIVAAGVLALELSVRSLGVVPSVVDSKDLWSEIRDDVYGSNKVVLVGGSRIQLDVSPKAFERTRPRLKIRQLSLGGTWGLAILRDLAADPSFDGFVIVSVRGEALEPVRWDAQQDYVDYYHKEWSFNKSVSARLRTALATRLAIVMHHCQQLFDSVLVQFTDPERHSIRLHPPRCDALHILLAWRCSIHQSLLYQDIDVLPICWRQYIHAPQQFVKTYFVVAEQFPHCCNSA